jgi:hypothetical protein
MTVVHRTYTEFDIRAITITGLSAKPENDKRPAIGKFGTGLKYAIAVLLRNGCSVTIITPGQRHKLVAQVGEFRGQPFEAVAMRSIANPPTKNSRYKRMVLPFTTHYGINWEMWMAFRELHSNTLDEGGWTKLFSRELPDEHKYVSEGCAILVEGEAYEAEYYNMHRTFLDAGPSVRYEGGGVRIYDLPHEDYVNEFKYYRGLRAGDVQDNKMTLFIYDAVGEVYLTEERRVQDYFWDWRVANAIAESDDEELIRAVLKADDDYWESTLNFHPSMQPSETFLRVAATAKVRQRHYEYIKAHKPVSIKELDLDLYPTPWKLEGYAILAGNDNPVATRPNGMTEEVWKSIWLGRVATINAHAPSIFKPETDEAAPGPVEAAEDDAERVFLTEEAPIVEEDCRECAGCAKCMPF